MTTDNEDTQLDMEVGEGDYIFIIDREGNLKSYALPEGLEDYDEVPTSIEKIMKIFKAQRSYTQHTIH